MSSKARKASSGSLTLCSVVMNSAFSDLEDNSPENGLGDRPRIPDILPDSYTGEALAPLQLEVPNFPRENHEVDDDNKPLSEITDISARSRKNLKRHRFSIKISRIEKIKNELILWFDVSTTLPGFRSSQYKDVKRGYLELQRFANHLASANPECFVPSLPPPTNSFPPQSPDHNARLLRNFQRWFDRVTRSPLLARDQEFISFVESTFSYAPMVNVKPPASGLARKIVKQLQPPEDKVDVLREFRPVAKLIYQYADEGANKLKKVSKARRQHAIALHELGAKVGQYVAIETARPLITIWPKLAHIYNFLGDAENVKATLEDALYGDGVAMVQNDAYVIKETLTNRHILMRDLEKSQASSRNKYQNAIRLKGATNINATRVNEAIVELEDATQIEKRITSTIRRVTDNLVLERTVALQHMENDLLRCMSEYSLRFIECERRTLAVWESVRSYIRAADPYGGLSTLGREEQQFGRPKKMIFNRNQDDWSGDRLTRAPLSDAVQNFGSSVDISDDISSLEVEHTLDAKNAASLLADSVF